MPTVAASPSSFIAQKLIADHTPNGLGGMNSCQKVVRTFSQFHHLLPANCGGSTCDPFHNDQLTRFCRPKKAWSICFDPFSPPLMTCRPGQVEQKMTAMLLAQKTCNRISSFSPLTPMTRMQQNVWKMSGSVTLHRPGFSTPKPNWTL